MGGTDDGKLWGEVDQFQGLEVDFKDAMEKQLEGSRWARQGRVAVLRMSLRDEEEDRRLWTGLQQSNTEAAFSSGLDSLLFDNPAAFQAALKRVKGCFFGKQLIILEDLGLDWVNAIGAAFNVPPRFFALHWASPAKHSNNLAYLPLSQPLEKQFVVQYHEILSMTRGRDAPRGAGVLGNCWLNCTAVRPLNPLPHAKMKYEPSIWTPTCKQLLSFWASPKNTTDNTTAIMLIDPKPDGENNTVIMGRRFTSQSMEIIPYEMNTVPPKSLGNTLQRPPLSPDLFPSGHGKSPAVYRVALSPEDSTLGLTFISHDEWKKTVWSKHPIVRRLFDELVGTHYASQADVPKVCPVAWTQRARHLLLAKTSIMVNALAADTDLLTMKAMQNIDDITKFDFENLGGKEGKAWSSDWKASFFTQLWDLRESLELLGQDMAKMKKLAEAEKEGLDVQQWEELETTRIRAREMLTRTTESYLQTVSATGAKYANSQAESSKKIAGLAALFVPGSLVAAILAIPSFSGAGDVTKFWIFWTVSVPLAVVLGLLLLTDVPGWVQSRWTGIRTRLRKFRHKEGPKSGTDLEDLKPTEVRRAVGQAAWGD